MSQDAVELAKKEVRGCAVLGKSHEPCSTTAHILARALLAERERAERWKEIALAAEVANVGGVGSGWDGDMVGEEEANWSAWKVARGAALAAEKEGA